MASVWYNIQKSCIQKAYKEMVHKNINLPSTNQTKNRLPIMPLHSYSSPDEYNGMMSMYIVNQ